MGKANRNKQEKAGVLSAPAQKRNVKKQMPTWVGTAILFAVILLAVAIVVVAIMSGNGTFRRMRTVAKTEHFKVTLPMMSYLVQVECDSTVAYYKQLASQIGANIPISAGKGGTALDEEKPLSEQIYSSETAEDGTTTTVTWREHFLEMAKSDVEKYLTCCEYAYENDIELDDSEKEALDEVIASFEETAASYQTTVEAYLSAAYGEGVSKRDVRKMREIMMLADKAKAERSREILEAVPEGDVQSQYENNLSKYNTFIDYVGVSFTASFTPTKATSDTEADKAKNEELEAKYEAKKAAYLAIVNLLNACTTADEFNQVLNAQLQTLYRAEEIEIATEKKGSELTADEITECNELADARVVTEMGKVVVKNYNTANGTLVSDVNEWLANTESPRAEGDKYKYDSIQDAKGNKITDGNPPENPSTAYTASNSTYAVYMTTSALHRDNGKLLSVGHILFGTNTYKDLKDTSTLNPQQKELADRVLARGATLSAEEMAKELVTMMKEDKNLTEVTEGGRTFYKAEKAIFETYGSCTDDGQIFYTNIEDGYMVTNFNDWLFDPIRVEGEVATVSTEYGYHVMYYIGDEQPAWSYNIRVELASGEYDKWLEGMMEEVGVSLTDNEKSWSMLAA